MEKTPKTRLITQERLKDKLDYCKDSGVFSWKEGTPRYGKKVGYTCKDGYVTIRIGNVLHKAHRLAWLYVYGYLPENVIDHINRKTGDNRIKNLREVSQGCNLRNCKLSVDNNSGVTGVTWVEKYKTWYPYIGVEGRLVSLGYSKNLDDAVKSRWEAEKKYNFPNCCTTSSAYLFLKNKKLI